MRGVVTSSGSLAASVDYRAWGNPETTGGLSAYTPFEFPGAHTDPRGPSYLIGRYYDPATGQFLSVDPLVEQTAHGYEYTGDNPVNAIDPLGMVTCGGWLSWIPGCGTATAVQHALSGVARVAWPNHFGSVLEGVDFSMEAIGAAGLGSLVFTASVAGEVPSFGLSTVGVLSSFGIFAGAGALAYVAYRSFSDAYAGAAVTRRSLSGPSSNIQKLSLLGARPC